MFRWLGYVFSLVVVLWGDRAWAHVVDILWTPGGDDKTSETASRLRGELLTMGLEVRVQRAAVPVGEPSEDLKWRLTRVSPGADAVMTVAVDNEAALVVDVWISDDGQVMSRLVTVSESLASAHAPEKVAIRAAEALHSRFVERDLEAAVPPADAVRAQVTQDESPPLEQQSEHVPRNFALAAGGALVVGPRGLEARVVPLLRFEWSATSWLSLQAVVAGFGSSSTVNAAEGSARVSQHYGVLGVNYELPRLSALRPFIGTSFGGLLSTVDGEAQSPFVAHDVQRAAWLLELSLGTHWELTPRFYLTFAGHTHFTQPSIVVRVVDRVAGISGRPNWVASLAAGVRL